MKMIAKFKAGSIPGEVTYLSISDFTALFTREITGGQKIYTSDEAVWWGRNGRLGSRWQVDVDMYVMVNEQEDPFKYYTPPDPVTSKTGSSWGGGGSGKCGSGCCGSCKC